MADESVFNVGDILERAALTAIEAFLVVVPIDQVFSTDPSVLRAAGISAGAAALSVVINAVKQYLQSRQ